MTTSISCVLWERGLLSVLKRNEAEQIGPEAEQRIDSSDQEAGFEAEFGVWDYVEVLRASSSGALRMTNFRFGDGREGAMRNGPAT
jgi:hypothetical protein